MSKKKKIYTQIKSSYFISKITVLSTRLKLVLIKQKLYSIPPMSHPYCTTNLVNYITQQYTHEGNNGI